jgi:hypothetical protein
MGIRAIRRKRGECMASVVSYKRRDEREVASEWVHEAARHVKRSVGFVITEDVIQASLE